MLTSFVVWPQYGSPSVLAGMNMCPLAAGPLFCTCGILCTREMNSIIEVLCFLLSLLLLSPCSFHIYYTRDQDLPQAFSSSWRGDFIHSKIPQHGTSTSHVTLVIKGCWVPGGLVAFTDVCMLLTQLCENGFAPNCILLWWKKKVSDFKHVCGFENHLT